MTNTFKNLVVLVLTVFALTACGRIGEKVENKLNELQKKTESLDSLINKEMDEVLTLDSLVNFESDKVKKIDSIINKTSSKIDSISSENINALEKIIK